MPDNGNMMVRRPGGAVFGHGLQGLAIPGAADHRREGIAFPGEHAQHQGKLRLHDQQALVLYPRIRLSRAARDRHPVAHMPDESLARGHPRLNAGCRPVGVGREQQILNEVPRGSFAALGRWPNQEQELIGVVRRRADHAVRRPANQVPVSHEELRQDGYRIRFGLRRDGTHHVASQAW